MTFRHALSWKPLFYEMLLPRLGRLGPATADAALGGLGWLASAAWPPKRRRLEQALARARESLGADWNVPATASALAAHIPRFLARDYPLDAESDAQVFARFEVSGFEPLGDALAEGRGAILLASHLGGHLAGVHWLFRRGVPLRLLVQRPRHISSRLQRWFDDGRPPHPQTAFVLRREMTPGEAVDRILRARAALRDGMAVYLNGDIPWTGPNARPGRLVGHRRTFLSVWADLAAITRAPVIPVFCTHRPHGRFALRFDPPWTIPPGGENEAVARYLERLEAEIAAQPHEAVAHLLWPCYTTPPAPSESQPASARPALRPHPASVPLP